MHARLYAALAFFAMTSIQLCPSACADSTLFLSGAGGTSTDPFGGGDISGTPVTNTLEHEDIYGASAFSGVGAVTFTSLDYTIFTREQNGQPASAVYDVTIGMSTTNVSAANPFPNFAANRGADFTTVFTGSESVVPNASTDLIFPISPFNYDPANGNLLIDLTVTSTIDNAFLVNVINEPNLAFFDQSDVFIQGGTTSTVIAGDNSSAVVFGYVTPSATPEPSSLVPIPLGSLCLFGLMATARRASLHPAAS
jgi:hypothetical protein